ncbi:N-acetyltransferase [Aureimonas sp. AU12]|uniref:GNAT family N-acetyltransferase n=1 Tax=Aureimonas sp. AU12 TaxID=1638161 RepID=UPI000782E3D1|nr:GNAT family N-acetyltransferase [Aureimonas sp. AU12]
MDEMPRFTTIPRGKISAIATTLEMRTMPVLRAEPASLMGEVVDLGRVRPPEYLDLYRRVGADHLWFSRLYMDEAALAAILDAPGTQVHAYRAGGRDEGILELDFSDPGACEIKYFGVTAAMQGTGAARRLMNHAIGTAFGRGVERLWLHTNTIDHPKALDFYRRTGFTPIGQEIEIADDPRLRGVLPRDAAPQVPIFE